MLTMKMTLHHVNTGLKPTKIQHWTRLRPFLPITFTISTTQHNSNNHLHYTYLRCLALASITTPPCARGSQSPMPPLATVKNISRFTVTLATRTHESHDLVRKLRENSGTSSRQLRRLQHTKPQKAKR